MTTKHRRLMTYGERNPPIELYYPQTTWWCVVTWQIKSITYPHWHGLWPWNVASWWLMVRWTLPWSHMFLWLPGHRRSNDKLKTNYFFVQNTYGHQTLQDGNAWQGEAHNKVAQIWSRNHKRSRFKLKT